MKFNCINRERASLRTILGLMFKKCSNKSEVEIFSFDCLFLSLAARMNLFPGQGEFLQVEGK